MEEVMSKKVLITGGCGFGGSHVVEHILKNTDWEIAIIDKLTYAAGGFDRLRDIDAFDDKRVQVLAADFSYPISHGIAKEIGQVDYIIHMGASTHVDNSIIDPYPFVKNNVVGTLRMLEFAKTQTNLTAFVYFSTDEVFGPALEGLAYSEWDRYNSGNPYAASKAGGEEMALAFANTYRLPVIIVHCMNLIGERQHPEKFIPLIIRKIMFGETVTIHSNKEKTVAGSRFYIHCRNMADALLFILTEVALEKGHSWRHKFNIVGEKEVSNLELAHFIAEVMGMPLYFKMVDFHSARPGHDLRYALDGSLLKRHGWTPPKTFEESLEKVVQWTLDNQKWLYWDGK